MPTLPTIFWLSLLALAYIFAGYPVAVWALSRLRPRSSEGGPRTAGGASPASLSIVIAACNEGPRLIAKLDSIFRSQHADRIVEVLIGSDGSTDDTVDVVRSYPNPQVRCIPFPERRGKPSVLNALVPECTGDLLVFMDSRQMLEPAAFQRLADRFVDPQVGVVSGELVFRDSSGSPAAEGVGLYWKYEKWIRTSESAFRSVPGATGALYAMRRELFRPIPENTLLDDVVIPMQAVEQGYRCVLERGAEAYDVPSDSPEREAVRKRRTIAGCGQLVVNQPRWLLPWRNPIWWEFCSHKLARLTAPVFLVSAAVSNALLLDNPLYAALFALQVLGYAAAGLGWLLQRSGRKSRLLGVPLMFVSLNLTTVAALADVFRGRFRATWRKTA